MIGEISRPDGRSNQQVLIDHVKNHVPGKVFHYDELIDVLSHGEHRFNQLTVQGVVRNASARLLKEFQRALHNVRMVGYRLAHANDHTSLSVIRKHKADRQLKRGYELLKHVKWEELDPNARTAHEGMLMCVSGLYANQQAFDKRLQDIERVIANLGASTEKKAG